MITLDFSNIELKLRRSEDKTMVFDPVRKKWLVLTPEEHVRQHILLLFIDKMKYPASLLSVEKEINVRGMAKRFDIVVYDREHQPWMLVECKAPDVPVTEKTLHQLLNYQSVIQGRYWLLTNGHTTFCADAGNSSEIGWLTTLPPFV